MARQPSWIQPMLATLTEDYFSHPNWIYEPKLDGIRCLAFKKGREVRLLSRNRLELGYPKIATAVAAQPGDFIIDGEVAALQGDRTSFGLLQQARAGKVAIVYFVFDILFLEGRDLTKLDLLSRKDLLKKSLRWRRPLSYVSHLPEKGEEYLEEACAKGWEGLIAKRAASPYAKGRSKDWLKFKCTNEQEFVIGGYTDPQGSRSGFGALLVGYYEGKDLRYAGKVGTGFNEKLLGDLLLRMQKLGTERCPFDGPPPVKKDVHWVRPRLVAQVGFAEWTGDGRLRHPRFLGLRRDKKPAEVVREGGT